MCEFFVGQKVVCVEDGTCEDVLDRRRFTYVGDLDGLKKGTIYTVRALGMAHEGHPVVYLNEIIRAALPGWEEDGYFSGRFRALEYKAMSIFRAIAANPTIKILEDA